MGKKRDGKVESEKVFNFVSMFSFCSFSFYFILFAMYIYSSFLCAFARYINIRFCSEPETVVVGMNFMPGDNVSCFLHCG